MVTTFNTLLFQNITCRIYFNDDLDNGIEVSVEGEHIGTMVGMTIADEEDEEAYTEFICKVENWIIENE